MIIGLFHSDVAAIRKMIALAILQAMLQDAFCESEKKCIKYLKSTSLTSINQFSTQLDPLLCLQSHFSRPKSGGGEVARQNLIYSLF